MIRAILLIGMVLLSVLFTVHAQTNNQRYGLPAGALFLETQSLKTQGHPDRALMLWMLKPTKHPREADADDPYTCPEETRGSYYSGQTRVSLLNLSSRRVINTVKVTQEYLEGADSFDIPYRIHAGSYYHVHGVAKGREGKPVIIWLKDYNGDGKALEFALFDALFCMGLPTTLIGYSESQDRVIQYPIHLDVRGDSKRSTENSHWVDYLFSEKPKSPGHWKYEIDYRGRGGSLDKYEIRYNRQKEMFEGTYVWTEAEGTN